MKKALNIVLLSSFLILLLLIFWLVYLMKNNVGDINYNPNIDDKLFNVCDETRVFQYYSVGTSYIGERKSIREEVFNYLKDKNVNLDNKSAYITFRFIVNCNGQPGRYRYKIVDSNFKKTDFAKEEIDKLKNAVMSLKNWQAGVTENKVSVDSYVQINFKIENGEIKDIF